MNFGWRSGAAFQKKTLGTPRVYCRPSLLLQGASLLECTHYLVGSNIAKRSNLSSIEFIRCTSHAVLCLAAKRDRWIESAFHFIALTALNFATFPSPSLCDSCLHWKSTSSIKYLSIRFRVETACGRRDLLQSQAGSSLSIAPLTLLAGTKSRAIFALATALDRRTLMGERWSETEILFIPIFSVSPKF